MRNKRLLRTLSALCLTMVVAFGFTIPAFAQGSEQAPAAPAEDSTNDSNVIVEETEPAPALTPEGNAALVDDFGGNKQLITVTTKAGNYFYILKRQLDYLCLRLPDPFLFIVKKFSTYIMITSTTTAEYSGCPFITKITPITSNTKPSSLIIGEALLFCTFPE